MFTVAFVFIVVTVVTFIPIYFITRLVISWYSWYETEMLRRTIEELHKGVE
jgi:hypothetical protein